MSPVDGAAQPRQNKKTKKIYSKKVVHYIPEPVVHFIPEYSVEENRQTVSWI
jgi:hypothetical protein